MQKSISARNGDAAATTAGRLCRSQWKHRPPRRMQTPCRPPTALRMLAVQHKACPLLGPPLWKREPEATPALTTGLDAQTVADLHLAEREYLGGRKLAEMSIARMADGVAIAHDTLCGTVVHNCDNPSTEPRRRILPPLVREYADWEKHSLQASAGLGICSNAAHHGSRKCWRELSPLPLPPPPVHPQSQRPLQRSKAARYHHTQAVQGTGGPAESRTRGAGEGRT